MKKSVRQFGILGFSVVLVLLFMALIFVVGYRSEIINGYGGVQFSPILPTGGVPLGLTANATSSTTIDLKWIDNSTNEEGFYLEKANALSANTWISVQLPANTSNFTWNDLVANATYYFRIKAFNGNDNSSYSNIANATTIDLSYLVSNYSSLIKTCSSNSGLCLFDADGNSNLTFGDLQVVYRWIVNTSSDNLTINLGLSANSSVISNYIASLNNNCILDVDGDNLTTINDGLLIQRYGAGLTGLNLIDSVVGMNATRNTSYQIIQFIDNLNSSINYCANCAGSNCFNITSICTPNWAYNITSCLSGENRVKYYYQNGTSCANATAPENSTYDRCDYNGNNVVGSTNDVSSAYSLYIDDNAYNDSSAYNNSHFVEYVDSSAGNVTRLGFDFNFNSTNKLYLNNISIYRRTGNYGAISVDGLNNVSKEVRFEKENTNSVNICILDSASAVISGISTYCNGDKEYQIACDGSSQYGYVCTTETVSNQSYFHVTGLMHSAVKELLPQYAANLNVVASVSNSSNSTSNSHNNTYTYVPSGDSGSNRNNANSNQQVAVTNTDNGSGKLIFWIIIGALIIAIVIVSIVIISLLKKKEEYVPPVVKPAPIQKYSDFR